MSRSRAAKRKQPMNSKLKTILYVLLALGLVFLIRLALGGLSQKGERMQQERAQRPGHTIAERLSPANDKTTMKHEFMQRAIDLASENIRRGGGPFAAVIVKDGKIVAETGNTVTKTLDPTAHAEVNAIREACRRLQTFELRGCEIYSSCEPCPMCMAAIYWARLDKLYFAATRTDAAKAGFDDDFLYKELPLSCEQRQLPCAQILGEEGKQPFAHWAQYEEKIPY